MFLFLLIFVHLIFQILNMFIFYANPENKCFFVKVFQDIQNVCGVFVSEYDLEFNDVYNAASRFIQKDTLTADFIVLYCDIH